MSYTPEEKIFLDSIFKNKDDVRFLKIGAHDGTTCPLYEIIKSNKTWTGIFFEPHKKLFEELKVNYNNEFRFCFENYAVSDKEEEKLFYTLNENVGKIEGNDSKLCKFTELNSFYENVLMKLKDYFNYTEKDVESNLIKTISIDSILYKYNIPLDLDLLYVDAEGHDLVILNQIDFTKYKIKVLVYEFDNTNINLVANFRCKLKNLGYEIHSFWSDDVCILK
jgi:FkbM family methyltransferase